MIWILLFLGCFRMAAGGIWNSKHEPCLVNPCNGDDLEAKCLRDSTRPKKYRCDCSGPKFVELDGTCDLDECSVLKNICTMGGDNGAACKNTAGAYDCLCSMGYAYDNGTCTIAARYTIDALDGSQYNYGILGFLASTLLITTLAGLIALGITYGTYHNKKLKLAKRRRYKNRHDKDQPLYPSSEHYYYSNTDDVLSNTGVEKVIQIHNYIVCDKNEDGKFSCRYD